ncbi:grasp-with-spasm system SPASM domain peptide maturase [Zooshikella marina]|uniref:grasp-with-spasm system SPASM domain peptide maturase n=1 Tax=Zooshikella ganghwensis TaxID=202772 RepID=UPI001BAF9691|nr:grasp-with-spasm system SPASM domain peptide maturase [Zooshikella ganghwensis]MBU2706447.1 grasp-with-spasm system SPASM domain peptide maturase [Zooshikella ganghwensis]
MIYENPTAKCYLLLYSSIQIVKGYARSLLIDLERHKMRLIPNEFLEFIDQCKTTYLPTVLKNYQENDQPILKEYMEFIIENEYGFYTDQPECFPELDLTWKTPSDITNAVIDVNKSSKHSYTDIIKILDKLNCQAIDLRVFEHINFDIVTNFIHATESSCIRNINIYIPYNTWKQRAIDKDYFLDYPRVNSFIIHGSPSNIIKDNDYDKRKVIFLQKDITSASCCGYVSENLMIGNMSLFTESQHYNSCLNKKLSIDVDGQVKNCNVQAESYGKYNQIDVIDLVKNNKSFSSLWKITKDDILVCKDCEFRYVCVDCRGLISDNNNIYSKPERCNYNPYKADWEPEPIKIIGQ